MSEEKPRMQQMRLQYLTAILGALDAHSEAFIDELSCPALCRMTA